LKIPWNDGKLLEYDSKLPQYFNPRNNRVLLQRKFTMKNYHNSFITLARGWQSWPERWIRCFTHPTNSAPTIFLSVTKLQTRYYDTYNSVKLKMLKNSKTLPLQPSLMF
jgi:hypothetical protein